MLPSEIPRLATDPPVRVFPGVWKLLSFLRPPSWDGSPSPPHLYLFLSFIYFVLPPFKDNGLPFWVPNVLFQHLEVVLWNLLNVQMFFWWIWEEKVVSLSYSSAILGPPTLNVLFGTQPCSGTSLVYSENWYFRRRQQSTYSFCPIRQMRAKTAPGVSMVGEWGSF